MYVIILYTTNLIMLSSALGCRIYDRLLLPIVVATPSSTMLTHTETSTNVAALIYHTSTQRMSSIRTAAMTSMQQSSVSALQLQSTPVTLYINEELTSISHQSSDTPTPPTRAIATQGDGMLLWLHDCASQGKILWWGIKIWRFCSLFSY